MNSVRPKFKVAAVQSGSVFKDAPKWLDTEATLEKAIGFIEQAGNQGARLVVFPECFLPGYTYWSLDFNDMENFEKLWAKLLQSSVEVPGKEMDALCIAARRAGAYVVMGLNERDKIFPGRMYNSVIYISPQGTVLGTHRKICNTVQERLFHTPGGGGDNLRTVFDTEIGKLGGSICGEHNQLLLTHCWIMQGIQIHCSLWPGQIKLETIQDIHTRALCWTAHCFGVLSATYLPDSDIPKNFYRNSLFNVPGGFRGGSGVVNPVGEYLAGPVYDKETIVYADIDLADADRSRFDVNLTGIYSRWDILNVNMREETYSPVVPMESKLDTPPVSPAKLEEFDARLNKIEQELSKLSRQGGAPAE